MIERGVQPVSAGIREGRVEYGRRVRVTANRSTRAPTGQEGGANWEQSSRQFESGAGAE